MPDTEVTITSHSVEQTFAAAARLVGALESAGGCGGAMVALCGPMGAGKTHFVKGLAAALGVARPEAVRSPTFTLLHSYRGAGARPRVLHHIDLCRLEDGGDVPQEIAEAIGDESALAAVEWADLFRGLWPARTVVVEIADVPDEPDGRNIRIAAVTVDSVWAGRLMKSL